MKLLGLAALCNSVCPGAGILDSVSWGPFFLDVLCGKGIEYAILTFQAAEESVQFSSPPVVTDSLRDSPVLTH